MALARESFSLGEAMSVNYASFDTKRAYLSTEFGLELAKKWFSLTEDQLEDLLGRYKKGKRKGAIKGFIQWVKASPGWVKTDHTLEYPCGFVLKHRMTFARGLYLNKYREEDELIKGFNSEVTQAFELERELSREYKIFLEKIKYNKTGENH